MSLRIGHCLKHSVDFSVLDFFSLYLNTKDKMLSCFKLVYWKQNLKEKDSVPNLKLEVETK